MKAVLILLNMNSISDVLSFYDHILFLYFLNLIEYNYAKVICADLYRYSKLLFNLFLVTYIKFPFV